jgi:hypothetical protein
MAVGTMGWVKLKVEDFPGRDAGRVRWTFDTLRITVTQSSLIPNDNLLINNHLDGCVRRRKNKLTLTRSGIIRYCESASAEKNQEFTSREVNAQDREPTEIDGKECGVP